MKKRQKEEGGDFYNTFNTRNGLKFPSAIFEALVDGKYAL